MGKTVFSSLTSVNNVLTSHCDNLSTYIPSLFRHAISSRPDHATTFLRCCYVFEKKAKAIELSFYAKESGKRKKEIVLTRIGLTNMPLMTEGLIISSTSARKDRIWWRQR